MAVASILPQSAPSSDSDPTAAEIASLARELCAAEGLCWPVALAQAERDLAPLAAFAHRWDLHTDWQQLQVQWGGSGRPATQEGTMSSLFRLRSEESRVGKACRS